MAIYGKNVVNQIPVSCEDKFVPYESRKFVMPVKLLFVGSFFYANIHAVRFFVKKVLPYVDAHLTIVGTNMDKLGFVNSDKLSIIPNVPSLSQYYRDADVIIMPIFKGSGMKTKTCEAMMYGKYIVGTKEAFVGYHIDESFAKECNTEDEFINCINNLKINSNICKAARENYLKYYTLNASTELFCKILKKFNR